MENVNCKAIKLLSIPGHNGPAVLLVAGLVFPAGFFALDLFHLLQGNTLSIKGNPGSVGKISNALASGHKARALLAPVADTILRGNPDPVFEFHPGEILEAAVADIDFINPALRRRRVAFFVAINAILRGTEIKLHPGNRCQFNRQEQHCCNHHKFHQGTMTSTGEKLQEPLVQGVKSAFPLKCSALETIFNPYADHPGSHYFFNYHIYFVLIEF